jgi:hypothetical protein
LLFEHFSMINWLRIFANKLLNPWNVERGFCGRDETFEFFENYRNSKAQICLYFDNSSENWKSIENCRLTNLTSSTSLSFTKKTRKWFAELKFQILLRCLAHSSYKTHSQTFLLSFLSLDIKKEIFAADLSLCFWLSWTSDVEVASWQWTVEFWGLNKRGKFIPSIKCKSRLPLIEISWQLRKKINLKQ